MKGWEWLIRRVLVVMAFSSLSLLALIALFIFAGGVPILAEVGVEQFLLGTRWAPTRGHYGILPMIAGSLWVTGGALVLGVPIALACAIYLSEIASEPVGRLIKPALELLAGIPSVVYGFLGLVILVPLIRVLLGGPGFSVLAASCVLAVMILPTVTSVSYDALRAVPATYREGSLALGATRWQTIRMSVLPAARSGILAGIILGMGRAIGETMAVIMVAGNATLIPVSPLDPVRTLTSNIALELGYAAGKHREALFATGVVLFLIIMGLNLVAEAVAGRGRSR
ncbi:MAG: phosphate ABC transporter permease subunit PstC [Firmicutes bacterium]|nr:phosphate ABC transporter permease subunit PstC [Bacillota bacterium]